MTWLELENAVKIAEIARASVERCNHRQANYILDERKLLRRCMNQIGAGSSLYKDCKTHLCKLPMDYTDESDATQAIREAFVGV